MMISVSNLTKSYGGTTAIDNISFQVAKGEIVGFLGPNGAGKTTTMRIISCYMPATGGTVKVDGLDVFSHSLEVRKKIGYLPENVPLYPDMKVKEYLRYRGKLKGLYGKRLRQRINEVVQQCSVTDAMGKLIGNLSKGFRQRIGLADALINNPDLLILDEPTIGLDPNQIRNMRQLIKGLSPRHTVLLSSHLLAEVDMMCGRVLIINRGRIVASDTPENLDGLMKGNMQVKAEIKGDRETIVNAALKVAGVLKTAGEQSGEWVQLICECSKGVDVRPGIFRLAASQGWELRELRAEKRNLEDIFISLTRNENTADASSKGAEG